MDNISKTNEISTKNVNEKNEEVRPKTKEEHAEYVVPANCEINMAIVKFKVSSAAMATAGVTGSMY